MFKDVETLPEFSDVLKSDKVVEDYKKVFEDNSLEFSASIGPLPSGYGVTLAHPLRRVLLSSIPGFSITGIKIKGVSHIFSYIDGISEDVENIIINLKKIVFRSTLDFFVLHMKIDTPGPVYAHMFDYASGVEVLNANQYICTLASNVTFELEIFVQSGVGYVDASMLSIPDEYIKLDASFSPILRVSYEVADVRVGQKTDLDRVNFIIRTDGSVEPKHAFEQACNILIKQFSQMVSYVDDVEKQGVLPQEVQDSRWFEKTSTLDLAGRAKRFIEEEGLTYVGDLIQYTRDQIASMKRLGARTIEDIEKALSIKLDLRLGLKIKGWDAMRPKEGE
ncbi:MAG: DNA-directed RNA polymerase subunit alpha [Alphaproteobacteria bacterium]|nr:MAG: DNA-directed RNA polymerase subunit alpha [Alphaproteobacteria bacterium]